MLIVLDIDGVVRHFDPEALASIETRHRLEPGRLWAAAFDHERGRAVITGRLSRAAWIAEIDAELGSNAAHEWLNLPGAVDAEMRAVIDELRDRGRRVVALTNATDTIDAELERDGLAGAFDAVYSSSSIGHAKPDAAAFRHVLSLIHI